MTNPTHTVTYVATVTATQFPAGSSAPVGISAALNASNGPVVPAQNLDGNLKVIFTGVPDGDYSLVIQAFDINNAPVGEPYVVDVTVADVPVTFNLPTGGTVTIS
jgi:hypothetical protein